MISLFRNSKPLKEAEASETITRMLDGLLNTRTYTGSQSSHSTVVGNALAYINEHFSEPLTLENDCFQFRLKSLSFFPGSFLQKQASLHTSI